jgi:hypothetical protein
MARRNARQEDFECPVCGADVPVGSKSCPECGACEKSGWSENTREDGLDLAGDEFDYEKFVGEEFGHGAPKKEMQRVWQIVALVLLIATVLSLFYVCWR